MSTQSEIKNTYFDALYFASATKNKNESFYITDFQVKLIGKLIHYSKSNPYITWSSKNIAEHIYSTENTINVMIRDLRRKGYINTTTTFIEKNVTKRTITINWEFFEMLDNLEKDFRNKKEEPSSTEPKSDIEESSIEDNTTELQPEAESQPEAETNEQPLEKITLEPYNNNMTTTQLVNDYKKRMKFAPIGSKLTPAEFHQLTKDYFRKLDYKTVIEEVEKITDEQTLLEIVNVLINKVKELEPVTV